MNDLANPILIYALGGLCEVGKNTYCIENNDSLILIDAGVRFPPASLASVSYIIPDYTHLKETRKKIKALFITHGHEDHIGAIPFLLRTVSVPVIYAPKLAAALIRHKLSEWHLNEQVKIVEINSSTYVKAGSFNVGFFHVTHSIPDSYGVVVDTEEGRIVDTGDFKIDLTPIGPTMELNKIARLGDEGVDLLLSDSTNAELEGYTPSERHVIDSIYEIFENAPSRLIFSTFASNISRVQQIIEAAVRYNKVVTIVGRSMEMAVETARDFGYIKIPDKSLVPVHEIRNYPLRAVCVICTGSQGEPAAALSKMAQGVHKDIKICPRDTVVLSSSAIPGNGLMIDKVVNQIAHRGAEVYVNSSLFAIHSSGHPSKQELRLMLRLVHPKYFMPVHGEYRMLRLHGELANELGIPKDNIFVLSNGDVLELKNHTIKRGQAVIADDIYIDGRDTSTSNLDSNILQERDRLKDDGMVTLFFGTDEKLSKLYFNIQVKIRGLIYHDNFIKEGIAEIAHDVFEKLQARKASLYEVKLHMKREIESYVFRKVERAPIVVPIIMVY